MGQGRAERGLSRRVRRGGAWMGNGLNWLGPAEAARLIRRREVTPLEILDDTLEWIDQIDDVTHAWVTLRAEEARHEVQGRAPGAPLGR